MGERKSSQREPYDFEKRQKNPAYDQASRREGWMIYPVMLVLFLVAALGGGTALEAGREPLGVWLLAVPMLLMVVYCIAASRVAVARYWRCPVCGERLPVRYVWGIAGPEYTDRCPCCRAFLEREEVPRG